MNNPQQGITIEYYDIKTGGGIKARSLTRGIDPRWDHFTSLEAAISYYVQGILSTGKECVIKSIRKVLGGQ